MTQRLSGRDAIPHEPFELRGFGKSPSVTSRPEHEAIYAHLEDSACAWYKRYAGNLGFKSGQQFLGYPCGAKQPAALGAILDFDARTL